MFAESLIINLLFRIVALYPFWQERYAFCTCTVDACLHIIYVGFSVHIISFSMFAQA